MKKKLLYIAFLLLFIISIITVYYTGFILDKHKYYYIKQLIFYIVGFLLVLIINKKHLKWCIKNVEILYVINNLLLIYVLIYGDKVNGSKSWIDFGLISFQPSEFMKIVLIFFLVKIFQSDKSEVFRVIKAIIIVLIPSILTFIAPDTGVVLSYLFSLLFLLFYSKVSTKWTLSLIGIIIMGAGLLYYLVSINSPMLYNIFGNNIAYRLERLNNYSTVGGYQINNALIGIGSAGIFGHFPRKYVIYLIEAPTDFIFASILTYFGFIGGVITIMAFIIIDYHLISLAIKTKNQYKLTVIGVISIFLYQQIENIFMNLGITPITGITLPLVSYGGSSLISYLLIFKLVSSIEN